jgi:AcrR family transcriptional regulator
MAKKDRPPDGRTTGGRIDPRIERTREALRGALVALIEEKGFDEISVQDIAARAGLNRATFYLHYRDKHDLLMSTSSEVFESLAMEAGPIDPENLAFDKPPRQVVVLFQHVARNRDFYRIMLGKSGVPSFTMRMREYMAAFTRQHMAGLRGLHPAAVPIIDDAFISEFVAGALLGVVIWWLGNDPPHSPEYMADRFGWLSVLGAYRMMGLEPPNLEAE